MENNVVPVVLSKMNSQTEFKGIELENIDLTKEIQY
jgi:hypothetical protein